MDVIRRVGQLALDLEDRIAEVEINPLMVTPAGAIAIDAVVVVGMGGPEMAPHTPQRSSRPGKAVAFLDNAGYRRGPEMAA